MSYLWEVYFSERILERGMGYMLEGRVKKLEVDGDEIQAVVEGSQSYDVEITKNGEESIRSIFCSCPYAEKGLLCKHAAAVLYVYSEKYLIKNADAMNVVPLEPKTVHEVLETLDKKELMNMLEDLAGQNPSVSEMIRKKIPDDFVIADPAIMLDQVDHIFSVDSGWDGSIHGKDVEDFSEDMTAFVKENVNALVYNRKYFAAFRIAWYIYAKMDNTEIDDRWDETERIKEACFTIWRKCIHEADDEERNTIKAFIDERLKDIESDETEGAMYRLLNEYFRN